MYQITCPKHLKRDRSGWSWMFIFLLHFSPLTDTWLSRSELDQPNRQIPATRLRRLPFSDQDAFRSVTAALCFNSQDLITVDTKIKGTGTLLYWHVGHSARKPSLPGLSCGISRFEGLPAHDYFLLISFSSNKPYFIPVSLGTSSVFS